MWGKTYFQNVPGRTWTEKKHGGEPHKPNVGINKGKDHRFAGVINSQVHKQARNDIQHGTNYGINTSLKYSGA